MTDRFDEQAYALLKAFYAKPEPKNLQDDIAAAFRSLETLADIDMLCQVEEVLSSLPNEMPAPGDLVKLLHAVRARLSA